MNTLQTKSFKPVRIPTCPSPGQCDGFYIVSNLPPFHPLANKLVPCACTRAKYAAAIQAALPHALQRMTFETFQLSDENRAAFNYARTFASAPWGQAQFFLTLIGPNRRGKTHLAAAVVNDLLARGEPARFENVPILLNVLRSGYSDDSFHRRLETASQAPVLVLDDLGAENTGGSGRSTEVTWAHETLYQIVDYRILHELPTLFTTNLLQDMLPPRIAARLWDTHHAQVVAISGRNGQRP